MNRILLLLRVGYWGVIGYLPFALQHQHVDFTLWAIRNPDAECLQTGVPYVIDVGLFSWALMLLLWPLVIWNLGARFLWGYFLSHRNTRPKSNN